MRRIGVLMNLAADDPVSQTRMNAFVQALQQSGWTDGVNVRIDTRWAAADPERFRRYATELVTIAPDVILAQRTARKTRAEFTAACVINHKLECAV